MLLFELDVMSLDNSEDPTVTGGLVVENVTEGDWNSTMGMNHSNFAVSFIFTPYAFGVSGVFVWSALFLTCFQVPRYHDTVAMETN